MKLPILAVLATTTLLLSACQEVREENKPPVLKDLEQNRWSQMFKMVDADGNGKITPAEFQANYVGVTWLYFDKNGDGHLTPQEWSIDGVSQERQDWFRALDEDQDGVVSRHEFERSVTHEGVVFWFSMADLNGDGVITKKELGIE